MLFPKKEKIMFSQALPAKIHECGEECEDIQHCALYRKIGYLERMIDDLLLLEEKRHDLHGDQPSDIERTNLLLEISEFLEEQF